MNIYLTKVILSSEPQITRKAKQHEVVFSPEIEEIRAFVCPLQIPQLSVSTSADASPCKNLSNGPEN